MKKETRYGCICTDSSKWNWRKRRTIARPTAVEIREKCSFLDEKIIPFEIKKKINTKEELYQELAELKEAYVPYLRDLAPTLESYKSVIKLNKFVLDGGEITIPCYRMHIWYNVN